MQEIGGPNMSPRLVFPTWVANLSCQLESSTAVSDFSRKIQSIQSITGIECICSRKIFNAYIPYTCTINFGDRCISSLLSVLTLNLKFPSCHVKIPEWIIGRKVVQTVDYTPAETYISSNQLDSGVKLWHSGIMTKIVWKWGFCGFNKQEVQTILLLDYPDDKLFEFHDTSKN